jgi:hypothetical protein
VPNQHERYPTYAPNSKRWCLLMFAGRRKEALAAEVGCLWWVAGPYAYTHCLGFSFSCADGCLSLPSTKKIMVVTFVDVCLMDDGHERWMMTMGDWCFEGGSRVFYRSFCGLFYLARWPIPLDQLHRITGKKWKKSCQSQDGQIWYYSVRIQIRNFK